MITNAMQTKRVEHNLTDIESKIKLREITNMLEKIEGKQPDKDREKKHMGEDLESSSDSSDEEKIMNEVSEKSRSRMRGKSALSSRSKRSKSSKGRRKSFRSRGSSSRGSERDSSVYGGFNPDEDEGDRKTSAYDQVFGPRVSKNLLSSNITAAQVTLKKDEFNALDWPTSFFPFIICDLVESLSGFHIQAYLKAQQDKKEEESDNKLLLEHIRA